MALRVYSARMGYRGADGLAITRQHAKPDELPFAPSGDLLNEAKRRQREAKARWLAAGQDALLQPGRRAGLALEETNAALEAEEASIWAWYEPLFLGEMRANYRAHRPAWNALLARDEVTLLCVCTHATRCHRHLLRARILPALGATDGGERAARG